jgi:hypothetical protein
MAEQLVLDTPIVQPTIITDTFKINMIMMDINAAPAPDGVKASLMLLLEDNNKVIHTHTYVGQEAADYINYINTGNFTVESLTRQILQKLSDDGKVVGTVRDV